CSSFSPDWQFVAKGDVIIAYLENYENLFIIFVLKSAADCVGLIADFAFLNLLLCIFFVNAAFFPINQLHAFAKISLISYNPQRRVPQHSFVFIRYCKIWISFFH